MLLPDGDTVVATDGARPGLELAVVPRLRLRTLYARVGDAFAWLCIGATLVGVAGGPRGRRRGSF